jgi:hypothetical protein
LVRWAIVGRVSVVPRLGVGRWAAIFFGLFGSYGKNDQVDVQYQVGGRTAHATGLDILPPSQP